MLQTSAECRIYEGSKSSGGTYGGGKIQITAEVAVISGTISANGSFGGVNGGGSGGGVLIYCKDKLELTGTISTNGGEGGINKGVRETYPSRYYDDIGGGGGGGRIKLFYGTGYSRETNTAVISVKGGIGGGGYNGSSGTFWTNAAPGPSVLLEPEDNSTVANPPTFRFNVIDLSEELDIESRIDSLSCRIELSQDKFKTISQTFNQDVSLSGWSDISYKNGDEVVFTPTEPIPDGVYQWRVIVYDGWVDGKPSDVRTFAVGELPKIEIQASRTFLPADGTSQSIITVTLTDSEGNPISDATIEMTVDNGEISDVKNNGDGMYTATYTAGTTPGTVTITATATNSNVSDIVELTLTSCPEISQPGIYQNELSLTKGINIISLSLKPETPWTAKTVVQEFGATIVIRAVDGNFEAYVAEGAIGEDFPIEANKGYIVNVTKPVSYTLLGKPWGEPVAAPSIETENPTWAFVVTGVIQRKQSFRTPPNIARITNLRTGESTTAKIKPSGRFIAAFVDFSRRSVVQADDAIELSFIDRHGNLLSKIIQRIESEQVEIAYLNTAIELRPTQSALLPNYPNPFNPETWIPYQIAQDAQVTIEIFNVAGELIRSIELRNQTAGWYVTKDRAGYWNGRNNAGEDVASGIYFYKLKVGDFTATRRMVIVK